MLPQLRKLGQQYPADVAIVGVHSGKFTEERVSSSIRDASLRLGAVHPTINDRQFRLWRAYAVRAWPTLVAISPDGYVVGMQAGDFQADDLVPSIERVLHEAHEGTTLRPRMPLFPADAPGVAPGRL